MLRIKKVLLDEHGMIIKPAPKQNNLPADLPKKAPSMIVKIKPSVRVDKDDRPNGHWQFPDKLDPSKYFGFIYLIKDRKTGKRYIGKKQYLGSGKKNKGEETNWRFYVSSCNGLKDELALRYEDFDFIVLEQYKIRGSLGHAETYSISAVEALAQPEIWYNGLINKVSWRVKERITERHKKRLIEFAY